MKILIAGSSGFIGQHLVPALLKKNYQLVLVNRSSHQPSTPLNARVTELSWEQLEQHSPENIDAVINLAGTSIAAHRWNESIKQSIVNSRVNTTQALLQWCQNTKQSQLPHFYNASAIGIYGLQKTSAQLPEPLTEDSPIALWQPTDFLSYVGQQWEQAAGAAIHVGIPVTFLRFGPVLKRGYGILKKLECPTRLGLGVILGSGQQAFSWIHIDDVIRAILFLIEHTTITGPVNLCAPETVTQRHFAQLLANAVHRPLFLRLPAFIVNLLFGQMGRELLLSGQHVYPKRLQLANFEFSYPTLKAALLQEFK